MRSSETSKPQLAGLRQEKPDDGDPECIEMDIGDARQPIANSSGRCQHGAVGKKRHGRKSVPSAKSRRRQQRGMAIAEAFQERTARKIELSDGRARISNARKRTWDEVNTAVAQSKLRPKKNDNSSLSRNDTEVMHAVKVFDEHTSANTNPEGGTEQPDLISTGIVNNALSKNSDAGYCDDNII